jgi:hypothetical protein
MPLSSGMTTAEDIERAVEQLAPQELARFRAWYKAFDAQQFDAAIERDARAGKLDAHADEALAAHRAGRSPSCETFRFSQILDRLRGLAGSGSKAGRRQLRAPPARSAPSVAAIQEGRTLLSVRVGLRYRALAGEADDGYL